MTRCVVQKRLPSVARPAFLRHIAPRASSRKWPDLPKPLPLGATATTAASGGNREELLGPRPAGCKRQRSRRWEPQPGQWQRVSADGEGKPGTKEPLRSDGQTLCQRETSAAPVLPRQQPCPLRRSRASSPKGRALGRPVNSELTAGSSISRKR